MTRPPTDRRGTWPRWLDRWTVLSLPGVAVALLAWGPGVVLGLAAVVGTFVALLRVLLVDSSGGRPVPAAAWSRTVRTAGCGAMLGVSGFAVAAYLPILLLLLLPLQVVSSPPVTDRVRRAAASRPAPHPGPTAPVPVAAVPDTTPVSATSDDVLLADLDDRALCRAWRHSYWVLQDAPPTGRLGVVLLRACLLDELHRREPHALEAWLDSGARASEGPDRYLGRDGPPRGTTDDRHP